MNITSPVDIEITLATGFDRAGDAAASLGTAFDKLEARAHGCAAELMGKQKKSRHVGRLLIGAALVGIVVQVLRRASH